jgi:hypothetical protein
MLKLPCNVGEVSDGHHTFDELYDHRNLLFLALMKSQPQLSWFSLLHDDGTSWPGFFICGTGVQTSVCEHYTVTYHMPEQFLELARQTGAPELPVAMLWDGHTPNDVLQRLRDWVSCI